MAAACRDWVRNIGRTGVRQTTWNHDGGVDCCEDGDCEASSGCKLGFLFGYGFLAGIGFTMSLFIAMLAFDDMALVYAAERGIIAGSLLAGIAGAVILRAGRSLRHVN